MSVSYKQVYGLAALAGAAVVHHFGQAAAPTVFVAGTPTDSSIPLSWAGPAGATFVVQRAANSSFTVGLVTLYTGPNTGVTNSSGLSASTPYYYRVKAKVIGLLDSPYATTSATTAAAAVAPHVASWASTVEADGGTVGSPTKTALSNLYTGIVALNVWSKIHALYLFLPGMLESTYNFKNAGTFRLTYGGVLTGITSSAAGLTSDGTGYYNTGFVPDQHAAGADNLGFDLYEDFTVSAGLANSLGVTDYGTNGPRQTGIYRAAVSENHADTTCYMSSSDSDPAQQVTFLLNAHTMLTLQRSAGGRLSLYQYGRKVHEITNAATGLSGGGFAVWGFFKNNFNTTPNQYHPTATGTHKHLVIREALTDAEVESLTQLLHAYHIETGRAQKADLFFGDSISHELNVVDSWPKRYTGKAGTTMQNNAVSGQIGQVVINDGTFAALLPTYNAAIHRRLFLGWGTNDDNNGESASDFAALLGTAFDVAMAKGWPAGSIVALPAFYQKADANGASKRAYLAACGTVVRTKGGVLLNVYQKMKDRPNADAELFGADTLHPLDPVGPEFIATAVFAEIG